MRRRTAREFLQADRLEFEQRTRERLARSYERVHERTASGGAAVACRASTLRHDAAGEGQSAPPVPGTRVDQLERLARLCDTGALD